jgi:hypothetical protein
MYIIVYYVYYWQKTKFQLMLPMHEGDKPDVVYHSLSSDLWFSPNTLVSSNKKMTTMI